MAKRSDPYLRPCKDARKRPTSDFECSVCGTVFRPHPTKPGAITEEFTAHLRLSHPRREKEDVNQAAARIVREATER